MSTRRDFVVIMARGASSRMGQPKGLMACPDRSSVTFSGAIVELYESAGLTGVVATTEALVGRYNGALSAGSDFRVIGFAPGGETGQTLSHGWRVAGAGCTHLWAHPVDVPLVCGQTVARLLAESMAHPQRLVRPSCGGVPGHPVVLPAEAMAVLVAAGLAGCRPAREVMAEVHATGQLPPPRFVPVDDSGVTRDFDCPADFS